MKVSLKLNSNCFKREKSLEKIAFNAITDCNQMAELFLIKECMRQLYWINYQLNKNDEQ